MKLIGGKTMMQVIPNSGPLRDDYLDKLRAKAIHSSDITKLHRDVIEYIKALEYKHVEREHQKRLEWLRDISWTEKEE